jgi:FtsH-binding integral membrane protein
MSLYGFATKTDLTQWKNLLIMAILALCVATFVNLILDSTLLYWFTTIIGVLIFVGLTAYDTQKIKNLNVIGNEGSDEDHKEAIMGALTLYLDFINLFLFILGIFGKRKQNNPESSSW